MKFSILTLGCKVNQSESDIIEGTLLQHGHSMVKLSENPDYALVNTCSVTAKSDYQSRQLIRRALRSNAKVIVTGCYAQLCPEDIKRIGRDIRIVSNTDKYNIINILDSNISEYCLSYSPRSRPYIKIQDGCSHSCSFCIIPLARGKSHSRDVQSIVNQARVLEEQGYREIVLTGIHIGSYGRDLKHKVLFSHLIEVLLLKTSKIRFRISSLGPHEIDSNLQVLLKEKRICRHLHIPLQSGDDSILKRMNRPYDTSLYLNKVWEILREIPDIAIGTDVIVGFPGESEESFHKMKEFIEIIPFAYLHIFPYSSRRGAKSSEMPDQIGFDSKRRRYELLCDINNRKKRAFMDSQLNKVLDIIIEDKIGDGGVIGTSSNYLKIMVDAKAYEEKTLVSVRVAERDGDTLRGEVIEKE